LVKLGRHRSSWVNGLGSGSRNRVASGKGSKAKGGFPGTYTVEHGGGAEPWILRFLQLCPSLSIRLPMIFDNGCRCLVFEFPPSNLLRRPSSTLDRLPALAKYTRDRGCYTRNSTSLLPFCKQRHLPKGTPHGTLVNCRSVTALSAIMLIV
jgi:hypothetical protein